METTCGALNDNDLHTTSNAHTDINDKTCMQSTITFQLISIWLSNHVSRNWTRRNKPVTRLPKTLQRKIDFRSGKITPCSEIHTVMKTIQYLNRWQEYYYRVWVTFCLFVFLPFTSIGVESVKRISSRYQSNPQTDSNRYGRNSIVRLPWLDYNQHMFTEWDLWLGKTDDTLEL
jgi:hypothetical protein